MAEILKLVPSGDMKMEIKETQTLADLMAGWPCPLSEVVIISVKLAV